MAKGTRGRRSVAFRHCMATPYSLPSCNQSEDLHQKNCSQVLEKKDWEDATCSVCMEYPHNAVLLLCSSHEKGCRPYMCGTSVRYSNCLDQYEKAYAKLTSPVRGRTQQRLHDSPVAGPVSSLPVEKCEVFELACPLCRGQVKGWTVVEPAREFLNAKSRSCIHDDCSFVGTYRELRKHVRAEHPSAGAREVDPVLEQKWRRLERERERDDVISTIRSSMPGAVVFGDYVLDGSHGFETDENEGFDNDVGIGSNLVNVFLLLQTLGSGRNSAPSRVITRRNRRDSERIFDGGPLGNGRPPSFADFPSSEEDEEYGGSDDEDEDDGNENETSFVSRLRRQGRVLLGRSGRRRRRREANGGRR